LESKIHAAFSQEFAMRFATRAVTFVAAFSFVVAASAQPRPGQGSSPPPASAETGSIAKVEVDQFAQLFTDAGFKSKVIVLKNKSRIVQTEFWPGVYSGVIPQACNKEGECRAYQIFANLGKDNTGVTRKWIDAWNVQKLFVKAILSNGALIFVWDIALLAPVSPDYIKQSAKVFKYLVDLSTDFKP
jgi:hypothetical protein